jgi:hypothetical protein
MELHINLIPRDIWNIISSYLQNDFDPAKNFVNFCLSTRTLYNWNKNLLLQFKTRRLKLKKYGLELTKRNFSINGLVPLPKHIKKYILIEDIELPLNTSAFFYNINTPGIRFNLDMNEHTITGNYDSYNVLPLFGLIQKNNKNIEFCISNGTIQIKHDNQLKNIYGCYFGFIFETHNESAIFGIRSNCGGIIENIHFEYLPYT